MERLAAGALLLALLLHGRLLAVTHGLRAYDGLSLPEDAETVTAGRTGWSYSDLSDDEDLLADEASGDDLGSGDVGSGDFQMGKLLGRPIGPCPAPGAAPEAPSPELRALRAPWACHGMALYLLSDGYMNWLAGTCRVGDGQVLCLPVPGNAWF
ncbi:basement membrane-specific heparan sulfate proteoglycan core protein-like isoform X2 [Pteropus vampyrus]|uniref:Basement membrane-specific heparan sulfate proteoglycan core protein-like isoform X2 n=1 Tax=Pteropus vampyrus TaxID=132908 RepID=A0A6P6CCQ6_PTEVA|nr:basement membrane-specific heparan sulfate proteoglycan core protein-like isoform X2 [Pteropus vampyrus]